MEYWVLWLIGVAIVIGTRIAINNLIELHDEIYEAGKISQIVIHILVVICINLVGGIIVAKWIGIIEFSNITSVFDLCLIIIVTILGAVVTYCVGTAILGLYYFNFKSHICFVLVFIISIGTWSISVYNYNKNIETVTQNVITQKQEKTLLYFCNIPVQKMSGSVSGHSTLGTGGMSGTISTVDELTYWYANENGEGMYDTALADNSKIVFIENGESPYVEIIEYCEQTKKINHNNGKESVYTDNPWIQYIFHLPQSIMQYNLN